MAGNPYSAFTDGDDAMPRKPGEQFRQVKHKEAERRYNKAGRPGRHKVYATKLWRSTSRRYREEHPLCEACLRDGVVKPADLVHHKVDIVDGGDPFDPDNLESLCLACHNRVHSDK